MIKVKLSSSNNSFRINNTESIFKIQQIGHRGPTGVGVPVGGTVGQVLSKNSSSNYDTSWITPPSALVLSVNSKVGVVVLTKSDIGLSNVDNTSDLSKPISTLAQAALDGKQAQSSILDTLSGGQVGDALTWPLNIYMPHAGKLRFRNNAGASDFPALLTDVSDHTVLRSVGGGVQLEQNDGTAIALFTESTTLSLLSHRIVSLADPTSSQDATTKAYVDSQITAAAPDATTSIKGKVQLAGDLSGTADSPTVVATHLSSPLPLSQGGTGAVTSSAARTNIGLGNIDNTSDANKPISTATQTALDGKQNIDSDLTTIALLTPANDDVLQRKAGAWTNRTPNQLKTDLALTKSDVGLGNVNNTADIDKPISTATQAALDAKENTITAGSTSQYWRGDKTFQTLNKSAVGLGNVDDTSDANKPISTATQAALDIKQDLDGDLTSIAGLIPTNDDIIQRKAGAWSNRTPAQFKTDLSLTKSEVGLGNVPNVDATARSNHTGTQTASTISDFSSAADARISNAIGSTVQAFDSDLGAIAALTPTNDDVVQRKSGAWTNRTMAQLKTDLVLTKSDVGLGNVPNVDATARANHTGTQTASTISDFDTQVRTSRLDQMAAPTSDVSLNSHKLTSVTDPTNAQDAATKAYVDAVAQGLSVKAAVRVATTANITLSGEQTIDGVSVVTGDRVLVKNQTTSSQNGIYDANSGAWARSGDADAGSELAAGTFTFVTEGTTQTSSGWVQTTTGTITLGTTSLVFTQFSGAGEIVAGSGLTKTGSTLDIGAGTGISVASDSVSVDSTVYRQGSTDVAVADGGTGSSTASGARTNLGLAIGSDIQAYDATLASLATYNTNGLITQTAADTFTGRVLTAGSSKITVTDGNGVSGNPTIDAADASGSQKGAIQLTNDFGGTATAPTVVATHLASALPIAQGGTAATSASAARTALGLVIGTDLQAFDTTLTAFAAYNTDGILVQTGADAFTGRTIVAGSSKVSITNGSGVSGNPSIDIIEANISRNTIGGGVLTISNGGTGQATTAAAFDALSPNTTLGDISYRDSSSNTRLAGNTSTTKNFLTQTGSGTISAAPAWSTISANDVPNLEALNTSSGLTIAKGGTGATNASGARTSLGLAIGADVQAFDADLSALAALSTTGILSRTGAGTAEARTIIAGSSKITISNGDGLTGNPTLDVADATSSQKGVLLLAGDIGGSSAVPTVKPRTVTRTVGAAGMMADEICDGTADEVEINNAINTVNAAGGGKVILRGQNFNTTASIVGKSNVTLEGEEGCTITGAASDYRLFWTVLSGTSKTVYTNIKLKNIVFKSNYGNCVVINNSNVVRIEDCECYFVSPTGSSPIRQGIYIQHCKNVFINNNYLHELTGNGISITSTDYFTVGGNTVDGGPYCDDAIDVDFDFSDTSLIHSTHGTVIGNVIPSDGRGNGIRIENSDYITVVGNDVSNVSTDGGAGIKIIASNISETLSNVTVIGNTVYNCLTDGIAVQGANAINVVVNGNTVDTCGQAGGSNQRAGINLNAPDVICISNTVDTCGKSGGDGGGILINRRDGHTIAFNTVKNCPTGIRTWNGDTLQSYTSTVVRGNKYSGNTTDAVLTALTATSMEQDNYGQASYANSMNQFVYANALTGSSPTLSVAGPDTNLGMIIKTKGTGRLLLRPGSNASNAISFQNAAATNTILNIDTTNDRVGVNTTGATSTLSVAGSLGLQRTAIADTNVTLTSTHCIIAYTSLTVGRTATLPSATTNAGRIYIIKDETGSAGTNNITVATTSSQTIDGATTYIIGANYGWVAVYSNGANWSVVDSSSGVLDSDLTALANISTNGLLAHTGSGAAAARTLAAGSSKITITNGDGASGNPTVDIAEANLSAFNSSTQGVVPASGGGTTNFLRADGTWAAPPAGGSSNFAVATKTANYTLTTNDKLVLADAAGGAFTLTLPTAVGNTGIEFIIKRIDAALTNLVTIATTSSQTIDGKTTVTINDTGVVSVFVSDGSNWRLTEEDSYDVSNFRAKGSTLNRWYSCAVTSVAATTLAPTINNLRASPFVITKTTTIDQMAINVTAAGASSNIRVGIYADDGNMYPGALIVDAGSASTASTGVKTYSTNLPVTLNSGLYWLASVGNGTAPTIRAIAATGVIPVLGLDSTLGTAWGTGWQVAFTFAALPATFTASGTVQSGGQPGVFFRVSS